jgi:dihydrofolate reductase
MSKLRVESFSVSVDGFGAGPEQSLQDPLGRGGLGLHDWVRGTKTFKVMVGEEGGSTGIDNEFAARGFRDIGAWVMGRNMFGPVRGPWPDQKWKGWWGDNPPYHTDVFVLTHHARDPVRMAGGTTFHFVTDGIQNALRRAIDAANGLDVRLGGGVDTLKQYLRAKLVDDLHFACAPVLLGKGESLFDGLDLPLLGYRCIRHAASENAMHIVLRKE